MSSTGNGDRLIDAALRFARQVWGDRRGAVFMTSAGDRKVDKMKIPPTPRDWRQNISAQARNLGIDQHLAPDFTPEDASTLAFTTIRRVQSGELWPDANPGDRRHVMKQLGDIGYAAGLLEQTHSELRTEIERADRDGENVMTNTFGAPPDDMLQFEEYVQRIVDTACFALGIDREAVESAQPHADHDRGLMDF